MIEHAYFRLKKNGVFINFNSALIVTFFFADSFSWVNGLGDVDFRLSYVVLAAGLLFTFRNGKFFVSEKYVLVFSFLFFISLPGMFQNSQIWKGVALQLLGSIPFAYLTFYIVRHEGLERIYDIYLFVAKLVVVSVFLEQALYFIGGIDLVEKLWIFTSTNYDAGLYYRASGILYEPSQVGLILPPAIYLAIRSGNYKLALFILAGVILSFSSLGFIGALVSLVFSEKRLFKAIPVIIVAMALVVSAVFLVPTTKDKLDKGYDLFFASDISDTNSRKELENMGGTVATLVVNGNITYAGLMDAPVFGHGVGSFRILYNDYLFKLYGDAGDLIALKNREGGASLFFRILFEIGLLGGFVVFVIFFKKLVVLKSKMKDYVDGVTRYNLSIAASIFFIECLIRKDMIVSFYFWFFVSIFLVATTNHRYIGRWRQ